MLGTVLPVFNRLVNRYDLELLIIGSLDLICQKQIQEFFQLHPQNAGRVQVVGSVENDRLPPILGECDILVHPRLGDGCPNSVIEAMACGVAVVCGSWGGTSELVGDGGIVVETRQWSYGDEFIEGLCEAIHIMIPDLESYKKNARLRAEEVFDIKKIAKSYAEAMEIQI